ncbi:type III secretion system chaperone family protein [Flavisolibacter ginsengisoli]|jgi:hypothetical protein|uniref:Uncharacterized protein n=1 Tax=Flavisolibacter ginsengisoli DSM 18119 TaxID=1121884 RepID=A0A1M4XUD7_9BACT|nr:hypothetical protein [Flavisolibacter ginsengisoli]SHE97119.1 hypothetical protein SAMN02745131_01487 [Flavisolibacter ginsengisoli DSM 18119]
MLDKIFSWSKKKPDEEVQPQIIFGRYSDNNKSVAKVEKWNAADNLFKEKKYYESISAFFEYLSDDELGNVIHKQDGNKGSFEFYQGSKIIRGHYDDKLFEAEGFLASMPQASVPVMRRLLEMNFTLYYSRYAINGDNISMLFDSDIQTANPSKLYYGLKELATKTDKQDDLLVQDFTALKAIDTDHLQPIPEEEKEVKYQYFKKWIEETLALINGVDQDKYSGGIAYLLLALAYRIDYLIVPEGKLLLALEKIVEIYFRKDDRPVTEKNQEMIDGYQKLLEKQKEDFFPFLFRSKFTFSIVTPQNYKTIADAIYNANQNVAWYKDNKLPGIAAQISEYGLSYCQYSYSLPRPITEYFHLFMMINYGDFFRDIGFKEEYYKKETGEYNRELIFQRIEETEARWKEKYPELKFKTDKLKFDNEVAFNQSFTTEIEYLNLETK